MSRSLPLLWHRALRFGLTGLLVTGLHAITAIVLIEWLALAPPLANGVAFAVATVVSYVVNTTWSFSSQLHGRTLRRFVCVSVAGFLLAGLHFAPEFTVAPPLVRIAWLAILVAGGGLVYGVAALALGFRPSDFREH